MTVKSFIQQMDKRTVPSNPMSRIQTLARELAEGAVNNLWDTEWHVCTPRFDKVDEEISHHVETMHNFFTNEREGKKLKTSEAKLEYVLNSQSCPDDLQALIAYLTLRWNGTPPSFKLLHVNQYVILGDETLRLLKPAFDLLDLADNANVFISYKRSESSTFALLVNNKLKQAGLTPFLDMQLNAGTNWRSELERNISEADYLIVLLSHETLHSEHLVHEVMQAMQAGTRIVPIWHNGFEYDDADWDELPDEVKTVLRNTHTIRVKEENPLEYNTALIELLNTFGITP